MELTGKQKDRLKARIDAAMKRFAIDNDLPVLTVKECGTSCVDEGTLLQALLVNEKKEGKAS